MNTLLDIHRRLADPSPFLKAVLEEVCQKCIVVLKANMYGEKLPNEWTYEVKVSKTNATATIYHTRLEGDRQTWEILFTYHNQGTVAHFVAPKNALALSWVQNGQRYFSKGHMVSGIKAQHFAEKADKVIADYEGTLQNKWQRWMNTGRL